MKVCTYPFREEKKLKVRSIMKKLIEANQLDGEDDDQSDQSNVYESI